jgi:hypothetical protein
MSRRTKQIAVVLLLTGVCAFAFRSSFKRSLPGRVVRFAAGQPEAVQVAEDLADDVQRKSKLTGLQQWSAQTLSRYSTGQLATNGLASYWSVGTVNLAPQEIPDTIRQARPEELEVSIRLSETGQPECVAISWYLRGLVVGPPDYVLSFQPWCSKKAPGVYAYHLYK